jgi:hypothetical protein
MDLLSTKLLSPHLESDLQDSEDKEVMKKNRRLNAHAALT